MISDNQNMNIENLPSEIIYLIMSEHLGYRDVVNCFKASKLFHV